MKTRIIGTRLFCKTVNGQDVIINMWDTVIFRRGNDAHYKEAQAGRVTEVQDGLNYISVLVPFDQIEQFFATASEDYFPIHMEGDHAEWSSFPKRVDPE